MSWVAASIGLAVTGGVISGTGSILGGISKSKADKAAGDAAETGAEIKATATELGGTIDKNEADYLATEYDQAASEARAVGQRNAFDQRRTAKLALSTLVARAASSGGGASDPTVLKLASNIAERGEYLALSDMYTGENKARGLEDEAKAVRYTGEAKKYAADLEATGTRYLGAADKYGSRLKASGDLVSGVLSGTGTIISSLGSAAGTYAKSNPKTSGSSVYG